MTTATKRREGEMGTKEIADAIREDVRLRNRGKLTVRELCERMLKHAESIAALQSGGEAREDAERYRFLRNQNRVDAFRPFIAIHANGAFSQWVGELADSTIDALRRQESSHG